MEGWMAPQNGNWGLGATGKEVYLASDVDARIAELDRQVEDFRYGLSEFCRACEEAPPLKLMEWLDAAHKLGADILERHRK
jgi:hypothetical protein